METRKHVTCSSSPRGGEFTWIGLAVASTSTFRSNPARAKAHTRAGVASWQRRAAAVGSRPVCVPPLESELWWISSRYIAQHTRIKRADPVQFSAFDNQALWSPVWWTALRIWCYHFKKRQRTVDAVNNLFFFKLPHWDPYVKILHVSVRK